MARVTYVTCPDCKKRFYVRTEDFIDNPDAYLECPFCTKEFSPVDGDLYPPWSKDQ